MNRIQSVCFLTILMFSFISVTQVYSQEHDPLPYIGEYAEYALSYFGVPASNISIHLVDTLRLNSALIFRIRVSAKAIGVWSKLFNLDNFYEAYIDYHCLLPLRLSKKIRQKNIEQDWSIEFDQHNHIAKIDSEKIWSIPENCHSFFSMIYVIRRTNFNDNNRLEIYLDVESLIWKVIIKKMDRELIHLPAGDYKAIKFSLDFKPLIKGQKRCWKTDLLTNRMANENSKILIWLSDDSSRIMLMLQYKHSVFSTKVQLCKINFPKEYDRNF